MLLLVVVMAMTVAVVVRMVVLRVVVVLLLLKTTAVDVVILGGGHRCVSAEFGGLFEGPGDRMSVVVDVWGVDVFGSHVAKATQFVDDDLLLALVLLFVIW